jgi:hypothetical protein
MPRQLTLNQTVALIKDLAQSHEQINSVYFGDIFEFLNQPDNTYPSMFFALNSASIDNKELTYNFSLFFFDRQIQNEIKEIDVISDRILVAEDILAMMQWPFFDWRIEPAVSIEIYSEIEVDYLSGVKMDVSIVYPYLSDRCLLPEDFDYLDWLKEN